MPDLKFLSKRNSRGGARSGLSPPGRQRKKSFDGAILNSGSSTSQIPQAIWNNDSQSHLFRPRQNVDAAAVQAAALASRPLPPLQSFDPIKPSPSTNDSGLVGVPVRANSTSLSLEHSPPRVTTRGPYPPTALGGNNGVTVERSNSLGSGANRRDGTVFPSDSPISKDKPEATGPNHGSPPADMMPLSPLKASTEPGPEMETTKPESSRLLDELMERYERKEAETRKAHREQVRLFENEKLRMEKGWQDAFKTANYYQDLTRKLQDELTDIQAGHRAEMERERADRQRQIDVVEADCQKRCDVLQEKTLCQSREVEEDIKNSYETKLRQQAAGHEAAIQELQKKRIDEVGKVASEMDRLNDQMTSLERELDRLRKENQMVRNELAASERKTKNLQGSYEAKLHAKAVEGETREEHWRGEVNKYREQSEREMMDLQTRTEKQRLEQKEEAREREQQLFKELELQQSKFQYRVRDLTLEHDKRIAEATAHLKQCIRSLEADLVDNQDDMRPALGGSALQTRYRDLRLKVETITFNLDTTWSAGGNIGLLDPTNFLQREGKASLRFLLRSICWTVIMDGFFSSPFGFGAFGREEGKKMLINVYTTWQRLFDPGFTGFIASPELKDQEDFEPFYHDKFANWWRSATFQSIQSVLVSSRRTSQTGVEAADGGSGQKMAGSIVSVFLDNRARVRHVILDVLSTACNGRVLEEIEHEVTGLVECASLLAVEFGAHRAKICFGMPKPGDTVHIGAEFVDCMDNDENRGKLEAVELAVSPSLFMIGDGRKDLTTATCLCPGEIYPRSTT